MSQLLLSALAVVCPSCDGHNPPRAEVCASCATPLLETAQASAAPRAAAAPSAGKPATARPSTGAAPPGLRPATRTPPPTPSAGLPVAARVGGPPTAAPPAAARGPTAPAQPAQRPSGSAPVVAPATPGTAAPAPKAAPAARPAPAASRFGLSVIAGTSRGQRFKLPVTGCTVGRTRGAILFAEDAFLSAQHASFLIKDSVLHVRDESSASGVYVTISAPETIAPMALFIAGQRLFRFTGKLESPPPVPGQPVIYGAPVPLGQGVYGVEEILVGGRSGRAVITVAPLFTIGQANCDLSYPQDEGLASRHCELSPSPTGAQLRDLSGGLGTYVRLAPQVERPLRPGDRVRLGQHILQVELLG